MKLFKLLLSSSLIFSLSSQSLYATDNGKQQEVEHLFNLSLEELLNTVIGSRRPDKTRTNNIVPVDIMGVNELRAQSSIDVPNMLRKLIPSFNVGDHPLSGTSTAIRPASLRGLSPDHVLVMINGKRVHRSANIPTFSGGITDGSQGPNVAFIPAIALKEVQLLRDGAAAQYGADAIAGVMNFSLNDSPDVNSLELKFASSYAGDGDTFQLAGTYGMPLGDSGFIRFSGEFSETDATTRAAPRADVSALHNAGNTQVPDPAIRYGTPEITDNIKTFVNFMTNTSNTQEVYAFGGYSKNRTESDFFYRSPHARLGVYTDNDDGGNYLIGDMTPNDNSNCDGGIDFGGSNIINNPIAVGAADANTRLASTFSDPDCFSILEILPNGYTPLFGVDGENYSGAVGIRGEINQALIYDVSINAGQNSAGFDISNVPNPSFGSLSPTSFNNLGKKIQTEQNFNIDLIRPIETTLFSAPLNLAGGFEWRKETFEIHSGSFDSYGAGILASQGFLIGEEAFPGFSPSMAGKFSRENIAAYLDLETDITNKLAMNTAMRYENFDDFGAETTYKVAGIYQLTQELGIRSSYSTGFHAPTPGQKNSSILTNEFDSDGNLIESGVIPPTNPVAQSVGGQKMQPETSSSNTLGFVYESDVLSASIDYYMITVKDRITLSNSFSLSNDQKSALLASGITSASDLGTFRFFVNDFETKTEGVDINISTSLDIINKGESKLSWATNWTKTEVTSYDANDPSELLSATRVIQLEENHPEFRSFITLSHRQNDWQLLLRLNYFDAFTEIYLNAASLRIDAGSQVTFDFEATINLSERFEFVIGADNLFDSSPDSNPWGFVAGSKYPTTSPTGINGGFYYSSIKYHFK